ncbi:MAG TPA: bifunctional DNA-formamidopyrimidine glycosylase/DNA-(apurinic or apyrimidinic site) lyase [Blastocatellia bacterium]|nr:bifunctional DNA-formamidopyrimidine glycosylase/DNA-(apurinic or apyrimidinic site) lyase [Blastocatellia bacterium]
MPELPEVEMVARHLRSLIGGRTIIKAQLLRPGLAPENSPRQFAAALRQVAVDEVGRRGKHILIHLSNARTLIVHLRMTGRFLYLDAAAMNPKHTHALFLLDNQKKLAFTDQRHFGMMLVARTAELDQVKHLKKLAPEPFSAQFTPAYLYGTLQRSDQPIKLLLLDQTKVSGLGNIYAAEALHRAGINPKLPASRLSGPRTAALHREILSVLTEAIASNSTLNTNPEEIEAGYTGGLYESLTRVYEREGLPCYTCSTPIRRFTQGARSTWYCPTCQRR